ncbi:MAG: type I-U CRISPR-associated protein Cas5/Cas6 [Verrucomicrobia bacterium]|nr:type I-U CRISPR-associated protein Cas5/Cas6 [Verrucomicrobiota bacterium]
MLLVELRFPVGRFHATPWGRHVNEGAVEWPPSPWRFLRALVATWHLKATTDVPEPALRALVQALAASAPSFHLPAASQSHTRHYMPIIEGKNQKTTKVFDTFIHVGGPLRMAWDVALSPEAGRALALLCERLGYFGRAESLIEARVMGGASDFTPNTKPLPSDQAVPLGCELVRLLCPLSASDYEAWSTKQAAAQPQSAAKGRRKKAKPSADAPLPADLFEALHADTGNLQAAGWTLPPGSRLVDYVRPANCFDPTPSRPRRVTSKLPKVARFAVSSAVLPRVTRAISVAERIHQSLVRFSDQDPVFTGNAGGQPLQGHQHAFVFCEANGPRDAITHVTVFAPMGFDAAARRALEVLTQHGVWGHGAHDLQLVLLGLGDGGTFDDCPLFGPARIWRSLTPFVATRHPKTHRDGRPKLDADGWPVGSPAHDLRRLLAQAGQPLPDKVEPLDTIPLGSRRLRPLEFQADRFHGEGRRGSQPGVAFKVTFAKPVTGPLAFGYGAHFGLGLFVPL